MLGFNIWLIAGLATYFHSIHILGFKYNNRVYEIDESKVKVIVFLLAILFGLIGLIFVIAMDIIGAFLFIVSKLLPNKNKKE